MTKKHAEAPDYGYKGRFQYFHTGESLTKQSFKDECDINNVMKRFERTGVLEHVNKYQPQWGDYTNTPSSYQEALHQVAAANEMFLSLPARLRAKFDNDPGAYIAFVEDPANADELRAMGLLKNETYTTEGLSTDEAPQKAKSVGKPVAPPQETATD